MKRYESASDLLGELLFMTKRLMQLFGSLADECVFPEKACLLNIVHKL